MEIGLSRVRDSEGIHPFFHSSLLNNLTVLSEEINEGSVFYGKLADSSRELYTQWPSSCFAILNKVQV